MAHHTVQSAYSKLVDRINQFPQGAPSSDLLFKILELVFSEKEAELVSLLPIKPFTAEKAAAIWQKSLPQTRKILQQLSEKAILLDIEHRGKMLYVLPPPMAGFFEFSMMRVRSDVDQKLLSELFFEYLNVEDEFVKQLFMGGETQLGRTFVHEPALSEENEIHVFDFERASEVIRTASCMGISLCYCRHKMMHMERACSAPLDICMTFNNAASSLVKHGFARQVDTVEGMELLHKAYEYNLVQFGDNVRERVNFICNCCGCCCEAMLAQKRFSVFAPIHTTGFLPQTDKENCTGCGKCVDICPVEAMTLVSANDPGNPKKKKASVNESICLGCGLCARACPQGNITLKERKNRHIPPLNGVHRTVSMAIERGKLQNLIFDNRILKSHRAMAAVLKVIFTLPPAKQILANRQLKSKYLEALLKQIENVYPF